MLISHDTSLLAAVVNRVFHLDPHRATLDVHNTGWHAYLAQREAEERRRARERAGCRAQGLGPARPGGPDARERRDGRGGEEHGPARRPPAGRARTGQAAGQGRPDPAAGARRLWADTARHGRPHQVVRRPPRPGRRRPGRRPGQPSGGPRPQRRGQDDTAAAARRAGGPGRRPRGPRSRAADRLLRAGARHTRRDRHGPRSSGRGRAAPHRRGGAARARRVPVHRGRQPANASTSCPAARRPASPWRGWSTPAPTSCCWTSPPTTWTRPPGPRC